MRHVTHFLYALIFLLCAVHSVQASPVIVANVTVTDVTPSSFSVLWNGDQPAIPSVRIYSDADGNQEITGGLQITPHPLKGKHSSVREHARENGVLQIQVSGLAPLTTYYFQTVTISAASGEITLEPAIPQFTPVVTQDISVRTNIPESTEYFFTNDTILISAPLEDGSAASEGTIVAIQVEGSDYPVSGMVGDGVTTPFAAMDGANVFDAQTHVNMPLNGGEQVSITRFLGINGTETFSSYLLPPRQLAQQRGTVSLYEVVRVLQITTGQPDVSLDMDYDINEDSRIGMAETLYFLQVISGLQ